MGVISIAATQALTPGADLWIAGQPETSTWALKIDWILNFQLLRASRHEKVQLPNEVQDFLKQSGLSSPLHPAATKSPLIVAADLNLPCRWVLNPGDWDVESLAAVWRKMGEPTLRVFLPKTQNPETFAKEWTEITGPRDFQLVVE